MGKRIDILGRKFGVLTVMALAQSRKTSKGAIIGFWLVRCDCGLEKEMRVGGLMNRGHKICGSQCGLISTRLVSVKCAECMAEYEIQRRSLVASDRRLCTQCLCKRGGAAVKGKPAHNRLPGSEGGFNLLFARYKANAKLRGLSFDLTKEQFRSITKEDCHFCGVAPAGKWAGRKGSPEPYIYNGIDRLSSDIGYITTNVVPCCATCNYMKQGLPVAEFLRKVMSIYEKRCVPPKSVGRIFST